MKRTFILLLVMAGLARLSIADESFESQNFRDLQFKEGIRYYREGDYLKAREEFEDLVKRDNKNEEYKKFHSLLTEITKFIKEAKKQNQDEELIRKGIRYFIEDEMEMALACLKYAFTIQYENRNLRELLKYVESKADKSVLDASVPKGMTWVAHKLYKAKKSFFSGDYDLALEEAQKVLILEPNNISALMTVGSVWWALDSRETAMDYWDKALKSYGYDAMKKSAGKETFLLEGIPGNENDGPKRKVKWKKEDKSGGNVFISENMILAQRFGSRRYDKKAEELPEGEGKIIIEAMLDKEPLDGLYIRLYFNDGEIKTGKYPVKEGRAEISLPPAIYNYAGFDLLGSSSEISLEYTGLVTIQSPFIEEVIIEKDISPELSFKFARGIKFIKPEGEVCLDDLKPEDVLFEWEEKEGLYFISINTQIDRKFPMIYKGTKKVNKLLWLEISDYISEADNLSVRIEAENKGEKISEGSKSFRIIQKDGKKHIDKKTSNYSPNLLGGIGIRIESLPDCAGYRITGVISGTPAEKAELKENDIIAEVEGKSTKDMPFDEFIEFCRGEPGTKVKLKIKRGESVIEYELTREIIKVPEPVPAEKKRGIKKASAKFPGIIIPDKKLKMTPVEELLYDSLDEFYKGNYKKVIKLCEKALRKNKNKNTEYSITAYMRLGSAYFAIGLKDKAKECWNKVLEIDPDNDQMREFLENLE